MKIIIPSTFLLVLTILLGCNTYSEEDKKLFDHQIQHYLKKRKITCVRSLSGLNYWIKKPGAGHLIRFQDKVSFTYKGTFLNGEVFDNETKPITLKVSSLIPAWKEIMLELRNGAEVFMIVPPQLGYGDRKLDDIPPNSVLVFDMKIWNVE